MATIVSFAPNRAVDLNGFAVPGALATFYNSGTNRLRTVYADPACEVPHPSPLAADGAGVFPAIYDTGGRDVKVAVTTADGVMLAGYPMDPARVSNTGATGASGIQFDPTEDIPETNVQDAIERVQDNLVQPLLDYGLGVTGNGPLLSNIESPAIAAGVYRFNGTTVGTFPSGVTAATGGTVRVWRSTANAALMILTPGNGRRQHVRALTGGAWGAWSYLMQSSDTATDAAWAAGSSTAPAIPTPKAIKAAKNADDRVWTSVTGSRAAGTIYQNTTGRTIQVAICSNNGISEVSETGAGGWVQVGMPTSDSRQAQNFDVPPGHRYRCRGASSFEFWSELR